MLLSRTDPYPDSSITFDQDSDACNRKSKERENITAKKIYLRYFE